MAPQHTVLKVHQGSHNHNQPNPRCHHDRARSQVYHHGSACTSTFHTALVSFPSQFHQLTYASLTVNQYATWLQSMVSLSLSVLHLMQSLSLAIFVLYLTLLRINYGQSKGSMRFAFSYVPVDCDVFLVSWFLRTLLRNRFYFDRVVRKQSYKQSKQTSIHRTNIVVLNRV